MGWDSILQEVPNDRTQRTPRWIATHNHNQWRGVAGSGRLATT